MTLALALVIGAGAGATGAVTWSYLTDWAQAALCLAVRVLRFVVRPVPPLRVLAAPHPGRHAPGWSRAYDEAGMTQPIDVAALGVDRKAVA